MKKRLEWIDNVRGLMIILVAVGHIITDGSIDNTFNSIMRMPTFFMISGFLFSYKPIAPYMKRKFTNLIIPYFVYLIPILAIQMYLEGNSFLEYVTRLILGGAFLYGQSGVFWFITCLFFTQQIFNLFNGWPTQKIALIMLLFLSTAYINAIFFPNILIPMSINVCLYSCPLFFLGFIFKKHIEKINVPIILPIIILLLIYVLSTFYFNNLYTNMSHREYGVPFLSFILSVISGLCVILLFKPFKNLHFFSFFGRASLVIMYLHVPIKYILNYRLPVLSQLIVLVIAVLIPTLLYYLFKKNEISRKYLLGEQTKKILSFKLNL